MYRAFQCGKTSPADATPMDLGSWGPNMDPTVQVSHVVSTPSQFDAGVLVFPASRNPPLSLAPFLGQQSHASANSSNSIMLQA